MLGDEMKIIFYDIEHFIIYDFHPLDRGRIKAQISKLVAHLIKQYHEKPNGLYQVIIRSDHLITIYEFQKTMDSFLEEMELKVILVKDDMLYEFEDYFMIQDKKDVFCYQDKFYKKSILLSEVEYCKRIFGEEKEKIEPFLQKVE